MRGWINLSLCVVIKVISWRHTFNALEGKVDGDALHYLQRQLSSLLQGTYHPPHRATPSSFMLLLQQRMPLPHSRPITLPPASTSKQGGFLPPLTFWICFTIRRNTCKVPLLLFPFWLELQLIVHMPPCAHPPLYTHTHTHVCARAYNQM